MRPNRSRKEQVGNGLRLGIGAGAFLIAMMLLGSGLARVASSASPYQLPWSDWVGWSEIGLGCVLLLFTAQVWLLLVGGYALFGLGKSILALALGKVPYTHQAVPRLEAVGGAFFALATLLLLLRFVNTRPSLMDRVALTFYVLAIAWSGHGAAPFKMIDPWLAAGLIALAISWCVYQWKKIRKTQAENASGASTL